MSLSRGSYNTSHHATLTLAYRPLQPRPPTNNVHFLGEFKYILLILHFKLPVLRVQ